MILNGINLKDGDRFLVSTETDGEVSMFLVDRVELLDTPDDTHIIATYELGINGLIRAVTVHRNPTIRTEAWV